MIARRIPTSARSVESVFHRFDPVNTAVCATDDGAWWIQSRLQSVAFQGRDDTAPTTIATLHSPVAIAAGERAIYVTSCDDPRASRLGRIDRETRVLEWLCGAPRAGSRGRARAKCALQQVLSGADYGDFEWRGISGALPCSLAAPFATSDRETGYFASGRRLTVFHVDEL